MTPAEAAADARAWLGTPFVHQASLRGVGVDCVGLVGALGRDRGTPDGLAWAGDREAHAYGRVPNPRFLLTGAERFLDRIDPGLADVGDVVLMRFRDEPQHFAVISRAEPPYIIHASSMRGRVVENRLDDMWRRRIVRAYRYRAVL